MRLTKSQISDRDMSSDEVYQRVRQLAVDLANEGFDPLDICDALTLIGINGGIRAAGSYVPVVAFLKRVLSSLEAGEALKRAN